MHGAPLPVFLHRHTSSHGKSRPPAAVKLQPHSVAAGVVISRKLINFPFIHLSVLFPPPTSRHNIRQTSSLSCPTLRSSQFEFHHASPSPTPNASAKTIRRSRGGRVKAECSSRLAKNLSGVFFECFTADLETLTELSKVFDDQPRKLPPNN